ncbi:MAG TPA: SGNH/GDSL hydrolase family protein [Pyrinomonadaceae bacterium]|jgi:lysophospholipase L1-like esterase|nr:SGNH/GDSL hydrolase family protein [Pyrinomonadaceae bacterium]
MKATGDNFLRKLLAASLGISFLAAPFAATAAPSFERTNQITPANSLAKRAARGIENPAALRSFYEALAAVEHGRRTQPIRIAHYGDSHTAANILTAQVRRNFERDFGGGPSMREGEARTRILYDVLGINGARAVRLLSWNEASFTTSVAARRPDLVILAYGTNEVTDNNWSVESYQRMFMTILRRFRRAAPQASILIFGPPDRAVRSGGGWQSAAKMSALLEAERRAAIEMGAAFWSSCGAMGGAGSMNTWVAAGLGQRDHVHLTARGYIRLGDMFYDDFLSAYESYAPTGATRQGDEKQQQDELRRALQF